MFLVKTALNILNAVLVRIGISFILLYRYTISPYLGSCCIFKVSCSKYAIYVLKRFKFYIGLILIIRRILRCNPFSKISA